MEKSILLSTAYLPPVEFFVSIGGSDFSALNDTENYKKQSYRNRTNIYSPNGIQSLVIPILRPYNIPIREVKIEYKTPWQRNHWRSITTAYNRSPYFEFYQDYFSPFYSKETMFLFDFNMEMIQLMLNLLKLSKTLPLQSEMKANDPNRMFIETHLSPKIESSLNYNSYSQVFNQKHGFIKNLSIIDLLFNLGPHSLNYIIQNFKDNE